MKRTLMSRSRGQRGFSLAEVITATAIFAVIFIAALMLYDRGNRVYKQGVEASDMQQSTRVAFDKLVADLRMTGFDFDRDGTPQSALASAWQPNAPYSIGNIVEPTPPNGHIYRATTGGTSHPTTPPTWNTTSGSQTNENSPSTVVWQEVSELRYQQPDEQVEYAGRSLVGVRANFDYDYELGPCVVANTPCENGREPGYETDTFPVVTTGNDEIVIYALKPTNPPAGWTPPTLKFYADTYKPRKVNPASGDAEREITLPSGYDDCSGGCNRPPYTLYRITLVDQNNIAFTEQPIAENIRSVSYRYFRDAAATDEITTLPNGDGLYDPDAPSTTVAGRDTRSEIRAIRINLIGMNPQPDIDYTDTADTYAPKYRKYQLESLVVPRNIGRRGMKEFSTDTPGAPVLDVVCPGSCNAVYLSWTAPPDGGEVESYNVLWDTDGCSASGFTYAEDAGRNLEGYASTIPWIVPDGRTYYFAVQAINKFGSTTSNCVTATVTNTTRPRPPSTMDASRPGNATLPAAESKITIKWPAQTGNYAATASLSCSDGSVRETLNMPSSERRYYRLYKSKEAAVDPSDPDTIVVLDENTPDQPTFDGTDMIYVDTAVANCTDYYYRVATVDYCARNPAFNAGNDASLGVSSEYYPLISANGIVGRAETAVLPAKPVGFALAGSDCVSGSCDLQFAWNAVTKQAGAPTGPDIYIDRYIITVEENLPILGWQPAITMGNTFTFTGGVLTGTITGVPQVGEYRFSLQAADCDEGEKSDPVYYPCTFGGGGVIVTSPASFGGIGSAANPWIVEGASTVRVQTANPVKALSATVYVGTTPVGSFTSPTGTFSDINIPVPDLADVGGAKISIIIQDNADPGCALFFEYFLSDQPAPNCALDTLNSNTSIVTWNLVTDEIVDVLLKNDSAEPITVLEVLVTWTQSRSNNFAQQFLTANFNTGTVTLNCQKGSTRVDAPASTTIAANSSSSVRLNFERANRNRAINANPVSGICVTYRVASGDVLRCTIAPGSGTCDAQAAVCP